MAETSNTTTGGIAFNTNGKNVTVSPWVAVPLGNGTTGKFTLGNLFSLTNGNVNFKSPNLSGEVTKTFSDGSTVGIGAGWAGGNTNAFISGTYLAGDGTKVSGRAEVVNKSTEPSKTTLTGSVSTPIGEKETFTVSGGYKDGATTVSVGVSDPEKGALDFKFASTKDSGLGLESLSLKSPELKDPTSGTTGSFTASISDLLGSWSGVKLGVSGKNASGQSSTATVDLPEKASPPSQGLAPSKYPATISEQLYGEGSGLKINPADLGKYFPVHSDNGAVEAMDDAATQADTTSNDVASIFAGGAKILGDLMKELIPSISIADDLLSPDSYLPPMDTGDSTPVGDGTANFWDMLSSDTWRLEDIIEEFVPSSLDIDLPLDIGSSLDSGSSLDTGSSFAVTQPGTSSNDVSSLFANGTEPLGDFMEEVIPSISIADDLLSPDGYLPPTDIGDGIGDIGGGMSTGDAGTTAPSTQVPDTSQLYKDMDEDLLRFLSQGGFRFKNEDGSLGESFRDVFYRDVSMNRNDFYGAGDVGFEELPAMNFDYPNQSYNDVFNDIGDYDAFFPNDIIPGYDSFGLLPYSNYT